MTPALPNEEHRGFHDSVDPEHIPWTRLVAEGWATELNDATKSRPRISAFGGSVDSEHRENA